MSAQLLSLADGPSLLLDKPILLVGRHEECDIQLNSRKISRKHCVIALLGETLLVRDLGSTNGIRVNGVRVEDASLKSGDELVIGNFRYQIHVDPKREAPAAPMNVAPIHTPGAPAPAAPRPISEDDVLESADEPIALPEPADDGPPDDIYIRPEPPPAVD